MEHPDAVVVIGGRSEAGSYVLRIRVEQEVHLAFGRFKKGKLIHVPQGDYAYVGSALATRGPSSLARRFVRHATCTGDLPPHPIRATMLRTFPSIGLGQGDLLPRSGKRLHWNVDHLLNVTYAGLVQVFVVRAAVRIEPRIARLLEGDPVTIIIERGLGANDDPGNTHLFLVRADEAWWERLPGKLGLLLETATKPAWPSSSWRYWDPPR